MAKHMNIRPVFNKVRHNKYTNKKLKAGIQIVIVFLLFCSIDVIEE